MKPRLAVGTLVLVFALILVLAVPAAALPDNPKSMNARMMGFQEESAVIHLLVFHDDGREGNPAYVDVGQPLLFGFEWGGADIASLQAILDDPGTYFTVSVDGGSEIDIVGFYQSPLEAETQSGPAWTWDHDGDGPGDGDGDGVGDWSGPIVFFRYPHPGLGSGTHTFDFALKWDTYELSDSILVEASE